MSLIPRSYIEKRFIQTMNGLRYGTLHFVTPEGKKMLFKGTEAGPEAIFTIHSWDVLKRALVRGDIGLGEDYIAGKWEADDIERLFSLFLLNMDYMGNFAHGNLFSRIGFAVYNYIIKRNSRKGSRSNIEAHYDVGNAFYQLWLDESMTYSSALFSNATPDLKAAQKAKYQRILSKLGEHDKTILEIGCGWGGFAEEATAMSKDVTAITVSPSQREFAAKRLDGKAEVRLQDYRDTKGVFDMIVSIEMFEAVGEHYWPAFFNTVSERLKRGGKAVVQTITIRDEFFSDYRSRSDFIRHYVFPGGMLPSLQRFREEAAKSGLQCMETFSFGHDYARTLREWLTRFEAKKAEIKAMGYSEEFIRNWRFYLGICAAAFAVDRTNVVQIEMSHAA